MISIVCMVFENPYNIYKKCSLCPRQCGVNRIAGESGFCTDRFPERGSRGKVLLSCAMLHFGEEPPVVGPTPSNAVGGSGVMFFSGCTLKCRFCQNFQISRDSMGRWVDVEELANIMLTLEEREAVNINLVTGTHFVPSIEEAVKIAQGWTGRGSDGSGLTVPILWNTSGYETVETVEKLLSFVDVFLHDIKTLDPSLAGKLFNASDYPVCATTSALKMVEMRELAFDKSFREADMFSGNTIKRGVIVRHLVLPGELDSTKQVLKWFGGNLYGRAILSLMFQYEPAADFSTALIGNNSDCSLARNVSEEEVAMVYEMLDCYGIEDGFIQELSGDTITLPDWLPDFDKEVPFLGSDQKAVWHWKSGFTL